MAGGRHPSGDHLWPGLLLPVGPIDPRLSKPPEGRFERQTGCSEEKEETG